MKRIFNLILAAALVLCAVSCQKSGALVNEKFAPTTLEETLYCSFDFSNFDMNSVDNTAEVYLLAFGRMDSVAYWEGSCGELMEFILGGSGHHGIPEDEYKGREEAEEGLPEGTVFGTYTYNPATATGSFACSKGNGSFSFNRDVMTLIINGETVEMNQMNTEPNYPYDPHGQGDDPSGWYDE